MAVPTQPPTYTTRSWRDEVLRADPDWQYESRHPVVFRFGGGAIEKRDPGDGSGIYE